MTLESVVKNYEGKCKPTWLNTNQVYNRFDNGITGFFKNVKFGIKVGKEFHGIIKSDGKVHSAEN